MTKKETITFTSLVGYTNGPVKKKVVKKGISNPTPVTWVVAFYPENSMSPTKAVVRVWYKGREVTDVEAVYDHSGGLGFTLNIVPAPGELAIEYLEEGQLPDSIVA